MPIIFEIKVDKSTDIDNIRCWLSKGLVRLGDVFLLSNASDISLEQPLSLQVTMYLTAENLVIQPVFKETNMEHISRKMLDNIQTSVYLSPSGIHATLRNDLTCLQEEDVLLLFERMYGPLKDFQSSDLPLLSVVQIGQAVYRYPLCLVFVENTQTKNKLSWNNSTLQIKKEDLCFTSEMEELIQKTSIPVSLSNKIF